MEHFDYALRLDGSDATKLIAFLERDGGSFYVVKEGGTENPHFHAVQHSSKKLPAYRAAFVRNVLDGAHGNGAYSITKIKDLDKYERYMCKGEGSEHWPDVIARNGIKYTDEWVTETHSRYWAVNQELQAARAKLSMVDAVTASCRDASVEWRSREKIAEHYIREAVRRDKPINIFSVKSAVNLIQIKLCPDDTAILDLAATV